MSRQFAVSSKQQETTVSIAVPSGVFVFMDIGAEAPFANLGDVAKQCFGLYFCAELGCAGMPQECEFRVFKNSVGTLDASSSEIIPGDRKKFCRNPQIFSFPSCLLAPLEAFVASIREGGPLAPVADWLLENQQEIFGRIVI